MGGDPSRYRDERESSTSLTALEGKPFHAFPFLDGTDRIIVINRIHPQSINLDPPPLFDLVSYRAGKQKKNGLPRPPRPGRCIDASNQRV